MNVKLIGITKPNIDGVKTPEEFIVYCARVSNPSNQNTNEGSDKLIRYLIKHQHWSPMEMVSVVMEITTTRDIARQILRHRSFSFQEFSQRYADPTKDLSFEIRDARKQDTKNRQNSIELEGTLGDENLKESWTIKQKDFVNKSIELYSWAITNGIAKEQARAVLPEGMTHSRLYMAGSLRSWIHYCMLRCENGTQKEHQEIAKACWDIISENFPNVAKALEK
jgi:thymidylate synthase (FAD)